MCDMYINFWKPGCFVAWKVVYSALVGRMYGQVPGCQTLLFLHMLGTCLGMPLYHQRGPVQ